MYQVSVTQQKSSNAPFAWEIRRDDQDAPVARSTIAYKTMAAARDAGRRALSNITARLSVEERG